MVVTLNRASAVTLNRAWQYVRQILTKEDDDVVILLKYVFQHLSIDFLYLSRNLEGILISDPRQYFIFVLDITLENQRILIPEES